MTGGDPMLSVTRLGRCLAALMPQAGPDVEVIVADNGSSEDLGVVRERWPQVIFVDQPQKGAGPARNAGAAVAQGQWLAFLDADCMPSMDWLQNLQSTASEGFVYGGIVTIFDETAPPRSGAEAFERVFAFDVHSYLQKGFLPSCQLVMSSRDFRRVGDFRVSVSEDVEWCRRARSMGVELALEESVQISHPSRQDWPALRKKWLRLTSEGFLLEGQGTIARGKWFLKALLMPASVIVHAPKILRHSDLTWQEKRRALITLIRLRLTRMFWMIKQAFRNKA